MLNQNHMVQSIVETEYDIYSQSQKFVHMMKVDDHVLQGLPNNARESILAYMNMKSEELLRDTTAYIYAMQKNYR